MSKKEGKGNTEKVRHHKVQKKIYNKSKYINNYIKLNVSIKEVKSDWIF